MRSLNRLARSHARVLKRGLTPHLLESRILWTTLFCTLSLTAFDWFVYEADFARNIGTISAMEALQEEISHLIPKSSNFTKRKWSPAQSTFNGRKWLSLVPRKMQSLTAKSEHRKSLSPSLKQTIRMMLRGLIKLVIIRKLMEAFTTSIGLLNLFLYHVNTDYLNIDTKKMASSAATSTSHGA